MNAAEYFLPPNDVYRKINNAEAEAAEVRGYLEIEVSRINFITVKQSKHAKSTSPSALFKNQKQNANQIKLSSSVRKKILTGGVAVKVIWWGEQEQSCAKVKSTLTKTTSKSDAVSQRKNHKQRSSHYTQNQRHQQHNSKQQKSKHHLQQLQQQPQPQLNKHSEDQSLLPQQLRTKKETRHRRHRHHQTDKLRYGVRTSLALFLDYLRECPPIEIVATTASVSGANENDQVPLGQTQLPLPSLLLQKYAENYVNGCNFEYKTKIYALYRHVKSGAACSQVQQQQQLKTGEIQLRFKMLFTSTAPPPPTTGGTTNRRSTKTAHALQLPAALLTELPGKMTAATMAVASWRQTNGFSQQQTKLAMLKEPQKRQGEHKHNNNNNNQQQQQKESDGNCKSITTRPAGKSGEIMDAMKKLDANLAALLAAETNVTDSVAGKSLEKLKRLESGQDLPLNDLVLDNAQANDQQLNGFAYNDAAQQLSLFQRVNQLKLQLEALTLQAEGTKCMELLQSEIRPIFTVECQLSHELIKSQPRYDMFNIMQFESEKFQSLTQCTRFGQEDQRAVQLPLTKCENGMGGAPDLGRIHFTIWWREPGTCLNEMLGLGTLDIAELYNAALLEQCKRIGIYRRGVQLASLYLKISLLTSSSSSQQQQRVELLSNGNCNGVLTDSDTGNDKAKDQQRGSSTCTGQAANDNNYNNNEQEEEDEEAGNSDRSNNNPELSSNHFTAETSKVRLLRGFIAVTETRQLQIVAGSNVGGCTLICQPFWQQQQIVIAADANNAFNLKEQFSIINDDKFLKSVERQHLQLEIKPLAGIVRLPLHQFFIAYRDATITNHLCKAKLPVISIDCWAPIVHKETAVKLGEIKCLLAIGSEQQIAQLKELRGFGSATTVGPPTQPTLDNQTLRRTTDLLDMLQSALTAPRPPLPTVSVPAAPFKPLLQSNKRQTFKFILTIAAAASLPLNPGVGKGKKSSKRQTANKQRFTPNDPPSTYVTFQADDCHGCQAYKSHEGEVYATKIVEKSTEPQWQSKFRVTASVEYLTNHQKLFILKIWKKATTETNEAILHPMPFEDAIIGFAAINLNQKLNGGPNGGGGWHNIVDFNGRITGGLQVYIQPLEDVHKLLQQQQQPTTSAAAIAAALPSFPAGPASSTTGATAGSSVDAVIDNFEQTLDLAHLNLGQAIKRKFNELEQISQRLRSRLVDVTGEPFATKFDDTSLDNWQPLADDDDEFERDLMTPPSAPASPTNQPAAVAAAAQTSQEVSVDDAAAAAAAAMIKSKSYSGDDSPKE